MMGSLALVLHAHLPFVRHPEHEFFHEENWLFEAISESYVPLLQMMRRLLRRGVRFQTHSFGIAHVVRNVERSALARSLHQASRLLDCVGGARMRTQSR